MPSIYPSKLRSRLESTAPNLWREISALAEQWVAPALEKLDSRQSPAVAYPKTFNDPVWGVIELLPWEIVLLDSPLLQRLRGVRQLGMAHLVYPGAGHDRLEHSMGVVEAAERMIRALERNAAHRRRFGRDRDETVPSVSDEERYSTRLAALLHDIGHGPFSHATEELIEARYSDEFRATVAVLRESFEGVTSVSPGETIATLIVLSGAMDRILTHRAFGAVLNPIELPVAIAARILGSRSCLKAGYLSGIINGPVDADKLDYMARDCHHSGLPLGIDLTRLISKLEVVVVTPDNAPNRELRKRAEDAPERRFYDMGISQTGLGSYEQLVIARVLLHDRLYYHHKVRAAESMLRRLIALAEEERGDRQYSIKDLYNGLSDDILVGLIGGEFESTALKCGGERSRIVSQAIRERRIYYRAYAFAARFIAGLDGLSGEDQRDTRALMWSKLLRKLSTDQGRRDAAKKIHDKAVRLAKAIPELAERADGLGREEILVDLPVNKVVVRGGDIFTRTDGGHIGTPNLFFDPERWSQAYEHQKQCGFVFTPRHRVDLVALASRIVFFETFDLVMDQQADRAAKVTDVVPDAWLEAARTEELCSPECAEALKDRRGSLVPFHGEDFELPQDWLSQDRGSRDRIAEEINGCLPTGLPASFHRAVAATVGDLAFFVDMIGKNESWASSQDLSESELQKKLRECLHSRGTNVTEGSKIGGGEADLILHDRIIVEIKVRKEKTRDPFDTGLNYSWQARRYSLSLCSRVQFVVVGYRPTDETGLLPLPSRIRACPMPDAQEKRCEIRVVVPWGFGVPSSAKRPTDGS